MIPFEDSHCESNRIFLKKFFLFRSKHVSMGTISKNLNLIHVHLNMEDQNSKSQSGAKASGPARRSAARLYAVQGVYQMFYNDEQKADSVLDELRQHRIGQDLDGDRIIKPEGTLLQGVLKGVEEHRDTLEALVSGHMKGEGKTLDPLLRSILLCGSYELFAHHDIDTPVIIDEYLNLTAAFYDGNERALVNGILDAVRKTVRA